MPQPAGGASRVRHDRLDALRGAAIVWMAVFHFCYDLNHYGLWEPRQFFTRDFFWVVQRTCIVSLFVFCAGVGQAVALQGGAARWGARFWRRWAQVAACALLVSAGSALMFPQSWIFFGVLHGIAVMLIVLRLLAPLGNGVLAALALAAIALPRSLQIAAFDAPALRWLGLGTHKPATEDWVPLLPWLGVMLLGFALGRWLLRHRPAVLAGAVAPPLRPLAVLGRWSLSFYMLHQPVLIALLLAAHAAGLW